MPKSVNLDEFAAVAPPIGVQCWGARLTPEQTAKIKAAREAGYSYRTIAEVCKGWGLKVSESSVPTHLRGLCKCGD